MPDRRRRKFNVMDAMLLIAMTGLGLAGTRSYQSSMDSAVAAAGGSLFMRFPLRVRYFGRPAPLLISLTLALFSLRLLGPRPRYRRLVASPGFVACYGAALGLAITALMTAMDLATHYLGYNRSPIHPHYLMMRSITFAGPSVASAWLTLALLGRWRRDPDRDWVEVSGIALGVGWLGLLAATQLNF